MSKPLPVFVKDIKMAKQLAEISFEQEKILKKYWPGRYTFVLKQRMPNSDEFKTIALRIPKYKPLNSLLKKINKPLAQTSVNISGNPSMTKIREIRKVFGDNAGVGFIFDGGNLLKRKPSVIMDLTGKRLTRLR